ncbi:arginine N-succinyltransferase [Suttonella sp. R2A3]|uniref:arginine N-succinyltransferase n=1 Tax=Suttonella sp. R2A3 TaxID=2908648 RepID=UPI001F43C7AD|nr:arginine N-succinyltransferase [Suttonella sp. R2A3]UJF24254.1 arginine N-succinyltransferase [Suttonella sp. R2A3]
MLFLRPVEERDLDDLLQMSEEVGTGMTSMPSDLNTWMERVRLSKDTFSNNDETLFSDHGVYFMVAEDSETGHVVGTTAIYVGIGTTTPFYSYKQSLLVKYSETLNKLFEIRVLNLVNDFTRATEIGSLFLREPYRINHTGQFLSRARYLMFADFPKRFSETIIAEMRGWQSKEGHSPFWQALGKKFFDLPFENADRISATHGSQFIQDLMPKYPVYVNLLPKDAAECIGKPHDVSIKAIYMLEKEGFRHDGYVDVFDGGPTVQCHRSLIKSVEEAQPREVVIGEPNDAPRHIISNGNISRYRVTVCAAEVSNTTITLSQEAATVLGVQAGDSVQSIQMVE